MSLLAHMSLVTFWAITGASLSGALGSPARLGLEEVKNSFLKPWLLLPGRKEVQSEALVLKGPRVSK